MASSALQGKPAPGHNKAFLNELTNEFSAGQSQVKPGSSATARQSARLSPIRNLEPTPPPATDGSKNGRVTFSRSCNRVGKDQQEMSVFDVRKVYSSCELFKDCSAEFVRSLLDEGGPEARQGEIYDPNVVIVEQGTVGHAMYLIHRGEAEVVFNGAEVTKLQAGAHFGEMQLLGLTPMRTATVRSLTICHIFEVKSEVFVKLLLRFRQERRLFEREAMRRYRELAEVRRQQKRKQRQTEQLYGGTVSQNLGSQDAGTTSSKRHGESRVSISEEMSASLEAASQGDISAIRKFKKEQQSSQSSWKLANSRSLGEDSKSAAASTSVPGTASTNVGTASTVNKPLAIPGEFSSSGEKAPDSASSAAPSARLQGATAALRSAPKGLNNIGEASEQPRRFACDLLNDNSDDDLTPKQQNAQEDETFVQRVTRSLRTDTKRGFMAASSSWVPPVNSTWRELSFEEEESEVDQGHLLETRLLPPISLLSPAQKQGLLRQLRQQAHSKFKRGVKKLSVGRVLKSLQIK